MIESNPFLAKRFLAFRSAITCEASNNKVEDRITRVVRPKDHILGKVATKSNMLKSSTDEHLMMSEDKGPAHREV
jgi:hypothetical protein